MYNSLFKGLRHSVVVILSALTLVTITSCSDNDEPASIPEPQTFSGSFSTGIPSMPNFEPIVTDNNVTVKWLNAEQTEAAIVVGAFSIQIGAVGHGYDIGEMEISPVSCEKAADGSFTMKKDSFETQAGLFYVTGSLNGTLSKDGLKLTVVYKPGSMPFDVSSTFVGK